jgi:hypothetical protein
MISPNYAERGPHIRTAGSLLTGLTPLVSRLDNRPVHPMKRDFEMTAGLATRKL